VRAWPESVRCIQREEGERQRGEQRRGETERTSQTPTNPSGTTEFNESVTLCRCSMIMAMRSVLYANRWKKRSESTASESCSKKEGRR
jgi:hypothetical protein